MTARYVYDGEQIIAEYNGSGTLLRIRRPHLRRRLKHLRTSRRKDICIVFLGGQLKIQVKYLTKKTGRI